jgi:hypothetical protein
MGWVVRKVDEQAENNQGPTLCQIDGRADLRGVIAFWRRET